MQVICANCKKVFPIVPNDVVRSVRCPDCTCAEMIPDVSFDVQCAICGEKTRMKKGVAFSFFHCGLRMATYVPLTPAEPKPTPVKKETPTTPVKRQRMPLPTNKKKRKGG